jgi:hypothetical protein
VVRRGPVSRVEGEAAALPRNPALTYHWFFGSLVKPGQTCEAARARAES